MADATTNRKIFFKALGLDVWHDMGYDGSLGLTATGEKPVINDLTKDWWSTPIQNAGSGNDHSLKTALVFHQFAPGRKLVYLPGGLDKNDNNLYFDKQSFPYILNNGIDTMFCSFSHDPDGMDKYLSKLPYLFYCNSAGNGGEKSYDIATRAQYIFGVGSYNLTLDMPNSTSSKNPYIDFTYPDGIYIPTSDPKTWVPFNGTSCSTPALIGTAACINHFFILKTGKPLRTEKMYQFLKDHSKDVWEKGKDDRTGWGMPILPHPNDVDIEKYADKEGDNVVFPDTYKHWAKDVIDEVTELGLMNGYPNGSFRPDQFMTRAEVAKVIHNLLHKDDAE